MSHMHCLSLFSAAITECLRLGNLQRIEVCLAQVLEAGKSKGTALVSDKSFHVVSCHGGRQREGKKR
jgi:hypothetical protein